jgi:asparagine synthase (glutamine-hydrolysing)
MIRGGRGASPNGTTVGPIWLDPAPVVRGRMACVAEGRLDPEVLADLRATSPAEAVIAAFERHGRSFPEHLRGELAFALWDGETLTLGRDAFGIETLFWRGDQFASDAASLGSSGRRDPTRIAEQLSGTPLDGSCTFDAEIRELQPGCIWRNGEVSRWLRLDVDEDRRPVDEISASILDDLRQSITSRRPPGPTAVALSGGLDSSTIAAILRDQRAPIQAISIRWDHPASDERRFVRRLIATGGLLPETVDGDEIDPFSRWVRDHCGPGGDPFAASTDALLARAAGTIFFGFDGDNIVSLGFESLADRIRSGDLAGAWAQADAVGRSYGFGGLQLLRASAWPLLRPWRSPAAPPRWLSPGLVRDVSWEARLREKDHPRTQREDHLTALLDDDARAIRTFVLLARSRGVEARFPFMDVRLARRFLAIPAPLHLDAGFDRIMLRRAVAGVIPEDIRWRRGKANMTLAITRALHRWLPPLDVEPIAAWIDASGVRSLYDTFRMNPTSDAAIELWRILDLAAWLRDGH